MKTFTQSLSGLLSASALAIGLAVIAQPAAAQIAGSLHNLSTGSDLAGNTTQICVFCHTPHGSNTGVDAPLWNKGLPVSTYTPYNSATMDVVLTSASITGVSLACLSCHDGAQAVDNMINRPGSGLYTATTGTRLGVGLTNDSLTAQGFAVDTTPNLGTNLLNDHPIGMNFCSAATAAAALAGTCGDADFNDFTEGSTVGRMFVSAPGNATFDKVTDLPLYGVSGNNAQVVCATCHDPHNTANGTFLRISNVGSGLCLTCHNK